MTLREIVAGWQGTETELLAQRNAPSIELGRETLQTHRANLAPKLEFMFTANASERGFLIRTVVGTIATL